MLDTKQQSATAIKRLAAVIGASANKFEQTGSVGVQGVANSVINPGDVKALDETRGVLNARRRLGWSQPAPLSRAFNEPTTPR